MSHRSALTLDDVRTRAPSVFATQPHPGVSDKYRFIPTISVLETLMEKGWEPVDAGQHYVRLTGKGGYQKHMIRLQNRQLPTILDREGKAESVVEMVMFNSHNRTSAFNFKTGVFRFICANGLTVCDSLFEAMTVRHIGYRPDMVLPVIERVAAALPQVTQSINLMREVELSPEERTAFARAALIAKYGQDEQGRIFAPITPDNLLRPRRFEDQKSDLWTTFNVIQENSIRGGQKGWTTGANGQARRSTSRPVESISRDSKLNQALWSLAEEMKKLKVGEAA